MSKKKKKLNSPKVSYRREEEELTKLLRGKTNEEKIAICKERVAKHHHEPDTSSLSKRYLNGLIKLKQEKKMKERAKKFWYSIVSIPMGGLNK